MEARVLVRVAPCASRRVLVPQIQEQIAEQIGEGMVTPFSDEIPAFLVDSELWYSGRGSGGTVS